MKAPVLLSCSHAVFAFVAFPLSPVPFPVFYLGGTAGNRLNLHFAPRGQARRQVDD